MKPTMSILVLFLFLSIAAINLGFCNGSSNHSYLQGCIQSERRALLRFKQDLTDSSNRLASWTTDDRDCCRWAGVLCDNFTGHVLELNLTNPVNFNDLNFEAYQRSQLGGKLNPSLVELEQLIHLDLSVNDFQMINIPTFLGSMRNLRYLNLSGAEFGGIIPHQLGNLSNLQYLDLSHNDIGIDNLGWLSGLSMLKHLDLSYVSLGQADWMSMTNTLPSLVVLKLSHCQLTNHLPPLPIANFSSSTTLNSRWPFGLSRLVFLDLYDNYLQGPILDRLQNLTSLRHLDLSSNYFNDSISRIGWYKFSRLEFLSLGWNNLQGPIPDGLGNLTSLKVLDLSNNHGLEGRIPRSWGSLCNLNSISLSVVNLSSQDISEILDIFSSCISKKLEFFDLTNSTLSGKLTNEVGKFKNLKNLYLSDNSILGPIPSSLGELSSLRSISLKNNELIGSIPLSLRELSSLKCLSLSNNKLNGSIFPIFFENLSKLYFFDVSGNSLTMKVNPDWVPPFQLSTLRLGSCYLGPHFPSWLLSQKRLVHLDISNSRIVDTVPSRFWEFISRLQFLNLSHNQIHGMIPDLNEAFGFAALDFSWNNLSGSLPFISSNVSALDLSGNNFSGSITHFLCSGMKQPKQMELLNLENNFLFGELPNCWFHWKALSVLKLNNNKFSGSLPTSMGFLNLLESLHLRNNSFSGIIPVSFTGITNLKSLDLGENEFVGNVPRWLGEKILGLMFLNLHSNKFHGPLPTELCHLTSLRVFDLAVNNLNGSIPRCINNLSAMVSMNYPLGKKPIFYAPFSHFSEDALLVMKGKLMEYNTILKLVRTIDLSNNKFSGEIPIEVTNLQEIQSLNLSNNFFTGRIPENIGAMRSLESIDFSSNQLHGGIPQSMSSLNFLSHLNLSSNHLTGKIPTSTQLQSFDASSFINNELCGLPLPKNCTETVPPAEFANGGSQDDNEHEVDWLLYVSMILGFVMGFWGIIGPLIVSRRWRYKYCYFLDFLGYKFGRAMRKCC